MKNYLRTVQAFHPDAKRFLMGSFLLSIGTAINDLLFNLHLKNLGNTESFIGGVISAGAFGIMLCSVPAAFLAKKYSHKAMLIAGVVAVAVLYAVRALVSQPVSIMLLSLLIGCAASLVRVIPTALLMRLSTASERTYLFSVNAATGMLGLVAGAFIGGLLPYLFINLFELSGRVLLLDDAYRYSLITGAVIESLAAGSFIGFASTSMPDVFQRPRLSEFLARLPKRSQLKKILYTVYPHTIVAIGAGAVIPFIPLYLHDRFGATSQGIGFYMSLVQSAVAVGYVCSPFIAARLGVLKSIVVVQLCSLPFMAVMGFSGSITLVVGAFILRNVLMNMSGPFVEQYTMESVGEDEREWTSSIDILLWNLAWVVMAAVAGFIIEHYSYQPLFAITITLYAASSLVYWRRLRQRRTAGRTAEPPPVHAATASELVES
ncbi:MAG: MFS transporter [Rhizobacter sp.]|nr:MFS transporter [Chlorobiales bacterium]